jgi:hypothetical protein
MATFSFTEKNWLSELQLAFIDLTQLAAKQEINRVQSVL